MAAEMERLESLKTSILENTILENTFQKMETLCVTEYEQACQSILNFIPDLNDCVDCLVCLADASTRHAT